MWFYHVLYGLVSISVLHRHQGSGSIESSNPPSHSLLEIQQAIYRIAQTRRPGDEEDSLAPRFGIYKSVGTKTWPTRSRNIQKLVSF